MTPAEVVDSVKSYFKRKAEEEKEHWKRTRWQTYWIVNTQGKSIEKEIKETELGILFDDEIKREEAKKLSPKEMREHAIKLATYYMKRLPGFIKKGKGGGPKIYGEN